MTRIAQVFLLFIFYSCCHQKDSSLYNKAKYIQTDSSQILILYGYKKTMSHDLLTLIYGNYYPDSIILTLMSKNKIVYGKDILSEKDAYPIIGKIEIEKKLVKVTIFQDNYDLNKKEDIGWNGNYLVK
jgi:hypothetical protein